MLSRLRTNRGPADKQATEEQEKSMDRRQFISAGASAALAAKWAVGQTSPSHPASHAAPASRPSSIAARNAFHRHRLGVNYTPSRDWYFCWNDWQIDPIKRDLDSIAALGADHMRIMLIWPSFQPNLTWVSPAHLERFNQLLAVAEERKLDILVTALTGQLSGQMFMPPFQRPDPAFYNDPVIWKAEELYIREAAKVMKAHGNVMGFDFGNELDTCWRAETPIGDAWMTKMFALMNEVLPGLVHINGVDHDPWFQVNTFSPRALASKLLPVIHVYPYWTGALKYGGWMDPTSTKLITAFAALVRSYAGDPHKPVWCGESNTCIEQMPEKQQAEWLEVAVTSAAEAGVNWFTYWDSHDVDRKFNLNSLEYTLGLLTNDGRVKEQGRAFKRLVGTYKGKPVATPKNTPPPPPEVQTTENTWKWIVDYLGWKPKSA
jgi:endo-1,4-beta-mannosidase